MKKIFKSFLFFVFLPLLLPLKILRGEHKLITKILVVPFSLFALLPIWGLLGLACSYFLIYLVYSTGLVKAYVPVSGSSMMPTITDGTNFGMRIYKNSLFKPAISRGDIITFENASVDESLKKFNKPLTAIIKRVIGLPGDTVELRNGFVYLNGQIVNEPYTAQPRSTFGHEIIKECQIIKVPPGTVFAMGDNRKKSSDSRDYGFAALGDVGYILPASDQGFLKSKLRDTGNDTVAQNSSMLNVQKYIELLNSKRTQAGLKTLRLDPKLTKSAMLRAEAILKYNDSSYEATISGYPIARSMIDAGYYNIVYGEHTVFGYYEAQELLDYIFENPKNAGFYLDKKFQDIGIATKIGDFNGCPVQLVVQQLGGYVPPDYSQAAIDSWRQTLSNLIEIQPSWERVKTWGKFYDDNKTDVDRITAIISQRIRNISMIVSRMQANQWLTTEEKAYVEIDKSLYDQQQAIADKLNKR